MSYFIDIFHWRKKLLKGKLPKSNASLHYHASFFLMQLPLPEAQRNSAISATLLFSANILSHLQKWNMRSHPKRTHISCLFFNKLILLSSISCLYKWHPSYKLVYRTTVPFSNQNRDAHYLLLLLLFTFLASICLFFSTYTIFGLVTFNSFTFALSLTHWQVLREMHLFRLYY